MANPEIRRTPDGEFDELVSADARVHMEVMSIGPARKKKGEYAHVWMRVTAPDGRSVVVNIYSDTVIGIHAEEEAADGA